MTRLGVVIPVGPAEHHARWLDEAFESVRRQTRRADHIVLVDDMHGLQMDDHSVEFEVYRPPWLLGVAGAFNHGVARALAAGCDLVMMMGADDMLEPLLCERLVSTYEGRNGLDGFYWCDVVYQDGNEQRLPCNAAAVTRGFMEQTGGLPMDASSGAMDAALISALLVHRPELLIHGAGGEGGRYWARQHPQQETARMNRYGAANGIIRDVFTQFFETPQWGRFQ